MGDERALLEVMRDFKRLMFFDHLIERGYVKVWPSGYELTQAGRDALSPPPVPEPVRERELGEVAEPMAWKLDLERYRELAQKYGWAVEPCAKWAESAKAAQSRVVELEAQVAELAEALEQIDELASTQWANEARNRRNICQVARSALVERGVS